MPRARRRSPRSGFPTGWRVAVAALILLAGMASILVWAWPQESKRMMTKLKHTLGAPVVAMLGTSVAAQAPAPATGPVPPTVIGVNLSSLAYHLNSRAFANLLVGTDWAMGGAPGQGAVAVPAELLSRQGIPRMMPPGAAAMVVPLQRSDTGPGGVTIRCTWAGSADITVEGGATNVQPGSQSLSFRRTVDWPASRSVRLKVTRISANDPLRNLDCREANVPRNAVFDPRFVAFARQFKVLRFMDWQETNANAPVRWDTRAGPGEAFFRRPGGVSVEDMMVLARETGADPWFTIPWNADDDYITRFATYVRDNLPAGSHVYVEMSNEVWNTGFNVNRQAIAEGKAEALSDNPTDAGLYRYAERATQGMDIWQKVFAARPKSLVRVLATMHWSGRAVDRVLGFKDTPRHFDAVATAPYFNPELMKLPRPTTLDEAFAHLDEAADLAIERAAKHKASAQAKGLRYIAYEGGQHIVLYKDQPLMQRINQDPRMYEVYRHYLAAWKARIGDTFVHYASVQTSSRGGAFGLAEHPGQPLSETPKLRAVLEAR